MDKVMEEIRMNSFIGIEISAWWNMPADYTPEYFKDLEDTAE